MWGSDFVFILQIFKQDIIFAIVIKQSKLVLGAEQTTSILLVSLLATFWLIWKMDHQAIYC